MYILLNRIACAQCIDAAIFTDDARSVVCMSVCLSVLVTRVSCAKMAEPIDTPFGRLTQVRPRNHVLDGGQKQTNPFAAARRDKMAIRSFVKIL